MVPVRVPWYPGRSTVIYIITLGREELLLASTMHRYHGPGTKACLLKSKNDIPSFCVSQSSLRAVDQAAMWLGPRGGVGDGGEIFRSIAIAIAPQHASLQLQETTPGNWLQPYPPGKYAGGTPGPVIIIIIQF